MIELLRKRRSIRKFQNKKISQKKIEILQESLLRSPTSRNRKPWRFILVEDPKLMEALAQSKEHGSTFLKDAPLAFVITSDPNVSDVWVEDCSIASIIVQLTAQSLDLGSCWIQIRNRQHNSEIPSEDYIRTLFELPEHLRIESIIAIGIPAEEKALIPFEELNQEEYFI